jgi:hypothetical protein
VTGKIYVYHMAKNLRAGIQELGRENLSLICFKKNEAMVAIMAMGRVVEVEATAMPMGMLWA